MLGLCVALYADLLPDSLDSLRTLAGLQQLQERQQQPLPPPGPAAATTATGSPPWGGPWQAATAAARASGGGAGGAGERTSVAVDDNGQLAAKAGQVAASATELPEACARAPVRDQAFVTLITNNEGYPAGALAVAAALEVLDSQLRRIVLVTEDVAPGIQQLLASASWEVKQVAAIRCNQVLGPHVTADKYDLGAEYQQKKAKWLTTCTKFHVRPLPSPPSPERGRPVPPSTPRPLDPSTPRPLDLSTSGLGACGTHAGRSPYAGVGPHGALQGHLPRCGHLAAEAARLAGRAPLRLRGGA